MNNRWLMELLPLAAFVAAALIMTLWRWWCVRSNAKNPVTTVAAEVVDKRKTTSRGRRGFVGQAHHAYYVTFRPADGGGEVELQVGEAEYNAYRWKDRGQLSYRTWEFISFRPERKAEGAVPVAFADEEDKS